MDDSSESGDSSMGTPGKARQRLGSLKIRAKDKLKQLKNRSGHRGVDHLDVDTHEALPDLDENPAFSPEKVQETLQEHHDTVRSKAEKTGTKVERAVGAVFHPQQSARAKAARETAETLGANPGSKPTARDERALVDAEDRLNEAKKNITVDEVLREDERKGSEAREQLDRVMDLEEHRDQMKVGYAMTHVNRVRVVQNDKFAKPRWQEYMHVQPDGRRQFDWLEYIGNCLLYQYQAFGAQYIADTDEHPFEADVLRSNIERLAMVTAPWQAWIMDIRAVYRWEDPVRTTRWLMTYIVLWYSKRFVTFIVGWIIWSIIRNKYIRASTDETRQSMKRAADSESAAWDLGELLDKHDSDNWLDEVGKTLGPGSQMYLGDLADFFEVLANFREWKSPKHTMATLILLSVHMIMCFMSWDFAARYLYGVMGLMFFVCWPIQSLHPKYRYAASLVQILLFNIPTHAQWAFAYFRRQALLGQLHVVNYERQVEDRLGHTIHDVHSVAAAGPNSTQKIPVEEAGIFGIRLEQPAEYMESSSNAPTANTPPEFVKELGSTPLVSFHTDSEGKHGRLVITASGIHFVRATRKGLIWVMPFDRLKELRKLDSIKKMQTKLRALTKDKAVSSGDRLLLEQNDGVERIIQLPRDRDKCFNCIIGFSGLQWQKLQGGAARYRD